MHFRQILYQSQLTNIIVLFEEDGTCLYTHRLIKVYMIYTVNTLCVTCLLWVVLGSFILLFIKFYILRDSLSQGLGPRYTNDTMFSSFCKEFHFSPLILFHHANIFVSANKHIRKFVKTVVFLIHKLINNFYHSSNKQNFMGY